MTTTVTELESRAAETAGKIERLTAQNEAATRAESEARGREQRCADRCGDLETQNAQLQERINTAQRLLTTADHDHRLLQVVPAFLSYLISARIESFYSPLFGQANGF